MHVRWIFVFSSACGSRARCAHEPRSTWRRSASTDASVLARQAVAVDRAHRRPRRRKRRCAAPRVRPRTPERRRRRRASRAPARTGSSRWRDDDRHGAVHGGRERRDRPAARTRPCASSACSISLRPSAAGRAHAVGDERDALAVEAEPVDRLEPDADVLERRHLGVADEQELVGVVERGEHRAVEERARCR